MMRLTSVLTWVFAIAFSVGAARAASPCAVPVDLALRDLALPAAKQSVVTSHRLVILTLGGAHTAGIAAGDPNATYPARLQVELTNALPGVAVSVVNNARPDNTVGAVVPTIPVLIAKLGAKLVIWAPGGRDAVRRPNLNEFFTELEAGIAAVRQSGSDLILLDMQYVPLLEQWSRIEDYRDLLRGIASANDVPLVPRHELMRVWSDDGTLDLGATDNGVQIEVTKKLFSCMARVLADPIAEAVR